MSSTPPPPSPPSSRKRKHDTMTETMANANAATASAAADRTSFERERQAIWGLSMSKLSTYQASGYQQLRRAVLVWQTMRTVFQSYQTETEQKENSAVGATPTPPSPTRRDEENETMDEEKKGGPIEEGETTMTNVVDVYAETPSGGDNVDGGNDEGEDDRHDDQTEDVSDRERMRAIVNQNKRVCCIRLYEGEVEERGSCSDLFSERDDDDVDDGDDDNDDDSDSGVGDLGLAATGDSGDCDSEEHFLTVLLGRSSLSQKAGPYSPNCSLEASSASNNCRMSVEVLEN